MWLAVTAIGKLYLLLAASFTLAALQNVTVDDAVLSGAVVPQYLPADAEWHAVTGNDCSVCVVKPDPSRAYNGTWHDSTYRPTDGYTPAIEFTFTGSALYIFFIIANNVTNAYTLTNVEFVLDEVPVNPPFLHQPSASQDYQYDVPVYANDALVPGQHTMMIQPVNSQNIVLMLFDYLIYTSTEMDTSVIPAATTTSGPDPTFFTTNPAESVLTTYVGSPPSSTSYASKPSVGPSMAAVVGGTVGGLSALVVFVLAFLWYRSRRKRGRNRPLEGVDAYPSNPHSPPIVVNTTPSTFSSTPITSPDTTMTPRNMEHASSVPAPPALQVPPAISNAPSSSSFIPSSSSDPNPALLRQVEVLTNEVARLRDFHDPEWYAVASRPEAPSEYSPGE